MRSLRFQGNKKNRVFFFFANFFYRSDLSDIVSNKINHLSSAISTSDLWNNSQLRKIILSEACPKQLLNLLGLETILSRIPESYGRAMFGCYLAR